MEFYKKDKMKTINKLKNHNKINIKNYNHNKTTKTKINF